jgi:hypothetical protein
VPITSRDRRYTILLWCLLCIVYSCIWSVTLAKSIVPRKTWRKLWHSYISKLFLTKMQVWTRKFLECTLFTVIYLFWKHA